MSFLSLVLDFLSYKLSCFKNHKLIVPGRVMEHCMAAIGLKALLEFCSAYTRSMT